MLTQHERDELLGGIKTSIDHLIELFENPPEGEPPGFGEVL